MVHQRTSPVVQKSTLIFNTQFSSEAYQRMHRWKGQDENVGLSKGIFSQVHCCAHSCQWVNFELVLTLLSVSSPQAPIKNPV